MRPRLQLQWALCLALLACLSSALISGRPGPPSLLLLRPNNINSKDSRSSSSLVALFARNKSSSARPRSSSSNPLQRFAEPSATNLLILLNALAFLATWIKPALRARYMKLDNYIRYGQTYRLATSLFLHGSVQHLLMNCYSLYQVGPQVERAFGTMRFTSTYLLAGLLANIATYTLGTSPASLGASGCTFGIIAALGVHFYRNRSILGYRAEAGLESIKKTVAINLIYGLAVQGIDNGAHIGGLLGGAAVAFLFGPRLFVLSGLNAGQRSGASNFKVVDRPLLNYTPLYRRLVKGWGSWGQGGSPGEGDGNLSLNGNGNGNGNGKGNGRGIGSMGGRSSSWR